MPSQSVRRPRTRRGVAGLVFLAAGTVGLALGIVVVIARAPRCDACHGGIYPWQSSFGGRSNVSIGFANLGERRWHSACADDEPH